MFLRNRVYDSRVLINLGMVFLVIANIGNYLLQRRHIAPESVSDPVAGFLFGLAFGCLGLGIWMDRRRRLDS
jgi:hypothetical protein